MNIFESLSAAERIVRFARMYPASTARWMATASEHVTLDTCEDDDYSVAHIKTGEYKDYIEANADVAAGLFSLISDFVDYGNHKNRMQRLAIKLEVSNK